MKKGKVIIFSAPSGSGKSTIVRYLLSRGVPLVFSISATSRPPRGEEVDGREYYFLSEADFRKRIDLGEFLEYEEVYPGRFYGTLKSEVEQRRLRGEHVVLDIDVLGAENIKKIYGDEALALFIQPPSVEALRERLVSRGTDSPDVIEERLSKAAYELSFACKFDIVVINDELSRACDETERVVRAFLES